MNFSDLQLTQSNLGLGAGMQGRFAKLRGQGAAMGGQRRVQTGVRSQVDIEQNHRITELEALMRELAARNGAAVPRQFANGIIPIRVQLGAGESPEVGTFTWSQGGGEIVVEDNTIISGGNLASTGGSVTVDIILPFDVSLRGVQVRNLMRDGDYFNITMYSKYSLASILDNGVVCPNIYPAPSEDGSMPFYPVRPQRIVANSGIRLTFDYVTQVTALVPAGPAPIVLQHSLELLIG